MNVYCIQAREAVEMRAQVEKKMAQKEKGRRRKSSESWLRWHQTVGQGSKVTEGTKVSPQPLPA